VALWPLATNNKLACPALHMPAVAMCMPTVGANCGSPVIAMTIYSKEQC